MSKPCAFCTLPASRIQGGDELATVASDGFPVSPGHAPIIPRRHIASFFNATAAERQRWPWRSRVRG
jgi:diadenosine tetraphosphate (Ap4A) HIT family hydrolase